MNQTSVLDLEPPRPTDPNRPDPWSQPPGIPYGEAARYRCGHNLLLAHAAASALYNSKFRPTQNGRLGAALSIYWFEPRNPDSAADAAAAQRARDQDFGWCAGLPACHSVLAAATRSRRRTSGCPLLPLPLFLTLSDCRSSHVAPS